MWFTTIVALVIAFMATFASPSAAQTPDTAQDTAQVLERPKVGVGFQASFPAYGLSGIYDLQPTVSLQAVAGFFGTWTTVSGRVLYRFPQRPHGDVFTYGVLGSWGYTASRATASALLVGGGAGVDLDWRRFLSDFDMPLFSNFEIGLAMLDLPLAGYSGLFMSIGVGLHYRF